MTRLKGILCIILSACIFGVTPVMGKITYSYGSNSTTLTFLRVLLCLPVLFCLLKQQKIPLSVTKLQFKELLILSCFGTGVTTIILYQSYNYIPVSTATTLHFVYPVFVSLAAVFIFKEHLTRSKLFALIIATFGICFFMGDNVEGGMLGFIFALVSGLTYAFFILYLEKSHLLELHPLLLTFYINLLVTGFVFIYGLLTASLTFSITPFGWFLTFLISILCGVFGLTLLQQGIKISGSTTAAILSMFEPITSVICGILFLGEPLTLKSLLGCALILGGVTILTTAKENRVQK